MAPANLIGILESTIYPLPLLLSGTDHRLLVAIAPFAPTALPGQAPADGKYVLCGDVTANGVLPSLVRVTNQSFHQMAAVPVLVRGDVATAWTALPAGENLLEIPDAAAAMHNITTRRATPIPHQFAENIIDRYVRRDLTWRLLWTDVVMPILADANMIQAYGIFLDFLQVASTRQAGLAAADPARHPETEQEYAGVITPLTLQDKSMEVARSFLLQLTQVQQNQAAMHQALVDATAQGQSHWSPRNQIC